MIEKTETMIKWSLDAVVNLDLDLAIKVCLMDDEVDEHKVQAYQIIKQAARDNPDNIDSLINLLLISRHLERMADHATNIAEEVVYMIEGQIFRHRSWDKKVD
jgi:phosphate transport system protein